MEKREWFQTFIKVLFIATTLSLIMVAGLVLPLYSEGATSSVTVTATVGSSVSCSSAGAPNFSALTSAGISTADVPATTTMSCNSALGCNLTVSSTVLNGVAGLASTTDIIESQTDTNTTKVLSAGTDGYGMQVTSTAAGSGAVLGVVSRWVQTGDTVGLVSSTAISVASASSPFSSRELSQTFKAAVSALTQSTNYVNTLTYTCTSN